MIFPIWSMSGSTYMWIIKFHIDRNCGIINRRVLQGVIFINFIQTVNNLWIFTHRRCHLKLAQRRQISLHNKQYETRYAIFVDYHVIWHAGRYRNILETVFYKPQNLSQNSKLNISTGKENIHAKKNSFIFFLFIEKILKFSYLYTFLRS